jgi:diacylglycerol O-acyltransferase
VIGFTGLLIAGYAVVGKIPWPVALLFYGGNALCTLSLASSLNRPVLGWVLASVIVPFMVLVLAVLPERPETAMSYADTTWSRMDIPANPMVVTAVMLFDEHLDIGRLKDTLQRRLLVFDRFRQRVVHRRGLHYWEDDTNFNIDFHVQPTRLPLKGDQAELQALVGDLMSTPLDFSRPLWQWYLVENYGSGCAIIIRVHHCVADGVTLVRLMLALSSHQPKPTPELKSDKAPAAQSLNRAPKPSEWLRYIHQGGGFLLALGKQLLIGPDTKTLLRGRPSGQKLAAWSSPISLRNLKDIGHNLGGHLNDIILTAIAGALGNYLKTHGAVCSDVDIRLLIPVNLRPFRDKIELGNRFAVTFLKLPLGIEDPIQRLGKIKQNMDTIKTSQEALANFAVINLLGLVPDIFRKLALRFFALKATAVMTNVIGPEQPVCIAGKPVRDVMFWVPQTGNVGMGISVLSYAGRVILGVTSDARVVSDPQVIVAGIHQELQRLLVLARSCSTEVGSY